MKKATAVVPEPSDSTLSKASIPDYKLISWNELKVSPTNPRRRINGPSIESLADSIRTQGILEPLIVRKNENGYEIVCGERRYRAAEIAKVAELPCLVRELSDEQVLDIQIHENLHREDVHPMDEAYGYQFLKDNLGCDIKELALRVGKSEGYILNRLKLNLLIKEAQKDIDDGHLPLVYALEIAKYAPDIQKLIYTEVYKKESKYEKDGYIYVPVKGQTMPWKSFVEWINTNVHHLIAKAPFDPKATNLRPDRLACTNCPERTGAAVSLFEPNQIGRKDACLNPACFRSKANTHVTVRRSELAEIAKVEPTEVPIVRSFCYSDGEGYLGTESAKIIDGANRGKTAKTCRHSVSGVDIEADNYGNTVKLCLKTSGCKTHWPELERANGNSSSNNSSEESPARLEAHRARREEIWNAKVAEAVRVRVFKLTAEKFEKKFRITDVGTDFLPQLIVRFWRMSASGDSKNLGGVVRKLMDEWNSSPKNTGSIRISSEAVEHFKKLERNLLFRILFLLVHVHKGSIGNNNNFVSQKEVVDLAAEFEVDYTLIDAEVRIELCAKKHSEVHRIYLEDVRGKKKDTAIPRLFSQSWNVGE